MTRLMMCFGAVMAPLLLGAAIAAETTELSPDAPRISVGSVMTPRQGTDSVPTTVEMPPPPTY